MVSTISVLLLAAALAESLDPRRRRGGWWWPKGQASGRGGILIWLGGRR